MLKFLGKKNSWALSNEFTLYYQERFDLATSLLENPDRIFVLWICLAWVVISCATFKRENRGDKSNLARVVTQKFSLFLDFQIFVVWTSAVSWNRTEREKNIIHGKRFLHKRSVLVLSNLRGTKGNLTERLQARKLHASRFVSFKRYKSRVEEFDLFQARKSCYC